MYYKIKPVYYSDYNDFKSENMELVIDEEARCIGISTQEYKLIISEHKRLKKEINMNTNTLSQNEKTILKYDKACEDLCEFEQKYKHLNIKWNCM